MSFENVYRSKEGTREIEKIASFIGSLVIKNQYEADYAETSESASEYYKYLGAYTKMDSFNDYSIKDKAAYKELIVIRMTSLAGGSYDLETIEQVMKKSSAMLIEYSTEPLVKSYLQSLRVARIYYYSELNLYYRQFLGLPNCNDDIITVHNYDYVDDNDPIEIPVHTITQKDYPKTYTIFILKEEINTIISKFPDLTYLRFINSGLTSYYLRELSNYSIIKYTRKTLSTTELSYFIKAYNKAKTQVLLDYIDGFDSKQPAYNILMIENLLFYTVINYSSSYIERFTLCDYTEENLDDILNSHGYTKLTEISSVDLKRKIVRNLPDLIENKANNYILELILDKIIDNDGSDLKRYYIEKKYKIGDGLNIKIDTSKSLENSVDLVFKEIPAFEKDEFSSTAPIYHDYDTFVSGDDAWGGISSSDTDEIKAAKRKALKQQILKINFNSILTKYITLTRTIDIMEAQRNVRDNLFLMFNYFDINQSTSFFNEKIQINEISATPASLFAAMCWVQQMKFYGADADTIIKDECMISSTATFRRYGTYAVDKYDFENKRIVNGQVVTTYDISPELSNWKVAEFLMKEEGVTWIKDSRPETCKLSEAIKLEDVPLDSYKHGTDTKEDVGDFMTVYRFFAYGKLIGEVTKDTTFGELLEDYQNQYPSMLTRIEKKLKESYDIREYEAWLFLKNQSRKNNSISFIFKEYETFSEYMHSMDSDELALYIQNQISELDFNEYNNVNERTPEQKAGIIKRVETIDEMLISFTETFKTWVTEMISSEIYKDDLDNTSSSYISDMIKLFDEFLSTYSELYAVNYKYKFGSDEKNGKDLKLFYNPTGVWFHETFLDNINNLTYKSFESISTTFTDEMKLEYDFELKYFTHLRDAINNELEIDDETKEYIIKALKYDGFFKFKQLYTDFIDVNDKLAISAFTKLYPEKLEFDDKLKIKYKEL